MKDYNEISPFLHQGYSLETSSSDAIFVDVFSHETIGGNMGTLLVSNSDGTTFTISMAHTNRDDYGETDFEKVPGLRGTLIVNTVMNHAEVQVGGEKKIQSHISYNDGGKWLPIAAPAKQYNGNPSICATQVTKSRERSLSCILDFIPSFFFCLSFLSRARLVRSTSIPRRSGPNPE